MTGGTKHKHSYLGRLAQDSLILSALNALQAKLGRALRRIPVRRPQSGAEGVFGALRRRAAVAKRTAVLKMKVASAVESSAAVRVYRGFVRTLLGLSMQTVAVFFITFGLYTLASSLIRLFTAGQPASPSELLPGVLSLLFAALFVGCGDSLQSKLRGSGLFRLVFVRLLGVDEQTLAGTASVRGYGAVAVIVGTLLGSLSYFVSAWRILLCLLSVLFALAVLRFPETGLLAALLLFPFLPAPGLAALLVVSFASYLLRLSRGKRNFRFAKPDGCFWFFAAASLLLLGGDTGASAALRLCCACAFPLCVNLLRSEKLLSRAAACLFVGLSAFAVLFCLTAWTPARAIWDALGLPVFAPTAAAAAVCLTALLPLCVQALLRAPARGRRLAALLLLAVDGCALVLLRSESVLYLALVVLTASFALSTGKALVALLGMGLFSLAAVGFVRCATAPSAGFLLPRTAAARLPARRAADRRRRRDGLLRRVRRYVPRGFGLFPACRGGRIVLSAAAGLARRADRGPRRSAAAGTERPGQDRGLRRLYAAGVRAVRRGVRRVCGQRRAAFVLGIRRPAVRCGGERPRREPAAGNLIAKERILLDEKESSL